jgi:hypothetical protein
MSSTDPSKRTTAHSSEPWYRDDLLPPNGRPVIARTVGRIPISATTDDWLGWDGEDEANARRICAAVNACQGISTEALENGVVKELLASSIKFSESLRNNYSDAQLCLEERDAWRDAIEKAMAP